MNSKQIRLIFGIVGFAATGIAGYFLYSNNFPQVYIFSIIAAGGLYTYVTTRSNLAVLGIVCLHVIALMLLSKSGSLMYLSIPYMALPFLALLPRGVLIYERLKHHLLLWLEPSLFAIAFGFYAAELVMNPQLPLGAKLLPVLYFVGNGMIMVTILTDGLKMRARIKSGFGMAVGEIAPAFSLQDEKNETVSLSSYKEKHHVLLIFVRGEWCPMCHIMMRTYMKESAQFQEKNVFLMVIGPDPTGVNRKMAEDLKLDFHILSDHNLEVTQLYKLKIKAGHLLNASTYTEDKEIPLPASFLIDKHGIIQYCSHANKVGEIIRLTDIFPILQRI
ncbi:MAG TPA: peroxiredoxin family protein, partial [Bacteroidia bacterium]|jgi:peroxiredoxin|nr:peroxiredoxin family protein [Bacteroidia bacterium]